MTKAEKLAEKVYVWAPVRMYVAPNVDTNGFRMYVLYYQSIKSKYHNRSEIDQNSQTKLLAVL